MIDSLPIDDVSRRTGLSARALRFYEARGLVAPLRTATGRRLFTPSDLERLHHVVALKKAGLSLGDIKRLFDRKPVALGPLLQAQRQRLAEQAGEIADALRLIDTALSRIDRCEPLDAATLCSLIRDGDRLMSEERKAWAKVVEHYHTPEEQADWRQRMPADPDFDQAAYSARWRELGSRIKAALPLDPASDAALGFVREWFTLLEPFSKVATPAMWAGTTRMYADMDKWQGTSGADPGFDSSVWQFIQTATQTLRAAGKDIGPLPAFMRGA